MNVLALDNLLEDAGLELDGETQMWVDSSKVVYQNGKKQYIYAITDINILFTCPFDMSLDLPFFNSLFMLNYTIDYYLMIQKHFITIG